MLARFRDWASALVVDRAARTLIIVSLALSAIAWLIVAVRLIPFIIEGKIIALHYSIYLGVDEVGPAWRALAPPLFGTLVLLLNTPLIRTAYARVSRSAALTLAALTALLEILAVVGSVYLILLNVRA